MRLPLTMTSKFEKHHLNNWDVQESHRKAALNGNQDTYISKRSSIASLDETSQFPKPMNRQFSPPIPRKQPHTLRYSYNALPENGIPLAIQVKQARKEEKERRKNIRKVPPGQGSLVPIPEPKPSGMTKNYFPYSRYFQAQNPDYIMRHRQTTDGQLIPYNYIDPSQYMPERTLTTLPKNPHGEARPDSRIMQYNPDEKRFESIRKDFQPTSHENYNQQRSSPKQRIPSKDVSHEEELSQFNTHIRPQQQSEKSETETDFNDHDNQSITPSKSPQDASNQNNNSNTLERQSKHHHHHHHSPSTKYIGREFRVADHSFKKSERTPYFQQTQNLFHPPPSAVYNQNSYFPPISRDYYYRRKSLNYHIPYKMDYYSAQIIYKDRNDSIPSPKIYQIESRNNFYDRYLNHVITKKITQ